ncbi:centrosomal protein of 41 kDa, partial [Malurus melanocephalus]|uniref:centrosomal protein of 41 kDa n=1 Tax=Malurus melanocephalus TaxID=175006 RepID=UPI0025497B5B
LSSLCFVFEDYRYKKDELFKRLKVTTFAQLVIQVASLSNETLEVTNEELQKLQGDNIKDPEAAGEDAAGPNSKGSSEGTPSPILFLNNAGAGESPRSTLQRCLKTTPFSSCANMGLFQPTAADFKLLLSGFVLCFLLKPEREGIDKFSSYSYPIATLSRTMNPYTNNILEYKNAHGKIIIVYDNDERLASQAATTMCERGFENLFMLSGGLKVLAQKIPEGLITGTLPVSCQVVAPSGSSRRKTTPRVPPTRAENKWRFSADDLQKLKHYLAEEHVPSDAASRLTRGFSSHDSKPSSVRSNPSLTSSSGNAGSLSSRTHSRTSVQNRPWK